MFWALVTTVSAALALGPVLWINGRATCHLPYYYAMRFLPFFHGLEFPYRFAIVTALGLSILAAIGLERLLRLRQREEPPASWLWHRERDSRSWSSKLDLLRFEVIGHIGDDDFVSFG